MSTAFDSRTSALGSQVVTFTGETIAAHADAVKTSISDLYGVSSTWDTYSNRVQSAFSASLGATTVNTNTTIDGATFADGVVAELKREAVLHSMGLPRVSSQAGSPVDSGFYALVNATGLTGSNSVYITQIDVLSSVACTLAIWATSGSIPYAAAKAGRVYTNYTQKFALAAGRNTFDVCIPIQYQSSDSKFGFGLGLFTSYDTIDDTTVLENTTEQVVVRLGVYGDSDNVGAATSALGLGWDFPV